VSDVHYTSDVAAGAAWGSLVGFGLPWLLHYREPGPARRAEPGLSLHLVPVGAGAGLGGSF
jgi:membrane-associated phospholipid phosphatase